MPHELLKKILDRIDYVNKATLEKIMVNETDGPA